MSLSKKTILILGGSQGAQSINKHIYSNYNYYKKNNYQIILQCGDKNYNSIDELQNNIDTSTRKLNILTQQTNEVNKIAYIFKYITLFIY